MRVAAVDIGTNTVRHLVADVMDGERLVPVVAGRAITRLGQGVDATSRLHPDAVARTLDAIEHAVSMCREHGAEKIRVAGTSALRDAADAASFARKVADLTGVDLDVISGAEEGRLSMLGATSGLPAGDYTVCDIGGGSTELSTSRGSRSLDIGSVRLKERCLHGDPPTPTEIADAREVIDDALSTVPPALFGEPNRSSAPVPLPKRQLVGVAGTITTVAAVVLGLDVYDSDAVHHSRLSIGDVVATSDLLLSMSAAEIMNIGPVERGRADVIGGGCLILRRVMEAFDFDEVLVSERDILDGLVLDLASR